MDANKAVASGGGTAAGTVLIWLLGQFGVQMPPEVAVAAVGLISTFLVYVVPHGASGGAS